MEGRVSWTQEGAEKFERQAGRWRSAGATHLTINTMGQDFGAVDGHLAALADAARALGLRPAG
jgi:hypothetical protein